MAVILIVLLVVSICPALSVEKYVVLHLVATVGVLTVTVGVLEVELLNVGAVAAE